METQECVRDSERIETAWITCFSVVVSQIAMQGVRTVRRKVAGGAAVADAAVGRGGGRAPARELHGDRSTARSGARQSRAERGRGNEAVSVGMAGGGRPPRGFKGRGWPSRARSASPSRARVSARRLRSHSAHGAAPRARSRLPAHLPTYDSSPRSFTSLDRSRVSTRLYRKNTRLLRSKPLVHICN